MAIKITSDAIVRTVKPALQQFSLNELNEHVDGWIEPFKIGPIWVMYREKAKENGEPLNQLASFFFDVAMHGTVIVVPPQQLPLEWELMEDKDYRYSSDQIDSGFLSALHQALVLNRFIDKPEADTLTSLMKEEWSYQPSDETSDNEKDFFRKVYDTIIKQNLKKEDTVLFEDDDVIVKTETNEDRIKALQQMIDYFVEEEEYEKCAKLLQVKEKIV
jgi:hypothetical protein